MEVYNFIVSKEDQNTRLDTWITKQTNMFSRSQIQKLIDKGFVTVNSIPVSKKYKVCSGDKIDLDSSSLKEPEIIPEDIPLDIVFEDNYLAIVNKPKGMVVHPATGNHNGTLVNALLYKYGREGLSDINGETRPGIIHRIDKDTSGLLIIAKTNEAHRHLAEQIKEHSFLRKYQAVVHGRLKHHEDILEFPIGRSPKDRKKMAVVYENCKQAKTKYQVIEEYSGYTWVELQLFTGRTHQIRVHMAHIGHPVVGDEVYGFKKSNIRLHGQCLHAKTIGFVHPITGEDMFFTSSLPNYFAKFLEKIR